MNQLVKKESYYRYWGKSEANFDVPGSSYHLLVYHCLDVAAVCRELLIKKAVLLKELGTLTSIKEDLLLEWMSFLVAMHDIGKFADGFQNLIPNIMRELQDRACHTQYLRHDSLGYRFCEEQFMAILGEVEVLEENNFDDIWDLLSPWMMAVTGHHGKPPSKELFPPPPLAQFPESVVKDAHSYIQDLINLFLPTGVPFNLEDYEFLVSVFTRASWQCAGISVAADWIGSNKNWFAYLDQTKPIADYWLENALPQAKVAIEECGLLPAKVSRKTGMQALFPELIKVNEPTPLQRLAQEIKISNGPQIFLIEEVTGGGKTEAALTLAHRIMAKGRASGIYMALPTMATANVMHQRIRAMYKNMYADGANPSLILAHSARQVALGLEAKNRKDSGYGHADLSASEECAFWLADNRKKALLAHVGVGTIDQALLAVLPVRHQSLRVYGLTDKVLIADEVHACDAYVHRLLCTLLRFHAAFGGSAILLSATLPQSMREELLHAFAGGAGIETQPLNEDVSYPLLTSLSAEGLFEQEMAARKDVTRRVKVEPFYSESDVDQAIETALEGGNCVCWVRNTIQDALDVYKEWISKIGEGRVSLFHARFTLFDRLNIENRVMGQFGPESRPDERSGHLLIATQVVEQSLDLDFDYMISDLAPIDLIIQRAGRLHRHTRVDRGQPVLGIFMPEANDEPSDNWFKSLFPKAAYVYPHHGQLWLTAKWLSQKRGFSMPEDARVMIESVYGDAAQTEIPSALHKVEEKAEGKDRGEAAMGLHNSINLDSGYQATLTNWQPDEYTPTRLGDPAVVVRLAKWQDGELKPLRSEDSRYDWELSQLSVRQYLLAHDPPGHEAAMATARESMPDGGRYCVIVPLERKNGFWQGAALDSKGNSVDVKYDAKIGLIFEKSSNESN